MYFTEYVKATTNQSPSGLFLLLIDSIRGNKMEEDFVPNGPASDFDIAMIAFNFVDHFVIWQANSEEYILNGRPEELEIALRRLLTEFRDQGKINEAETE